MALVYTGTGFAAVGFDAATGERGFLIKVTNGSGGASVKGTILAASTTADNTVIVEANGYDPIGVCAESGIADGQPMWMWCNGSMAKVLFKDATAATRGNVALCDDVDGRAYDIAVPNANPVVAEHFREIGHVCESAEGGENVLACVFLHFN